MSINLNSGILGNSGFSAQASALAFRCECGAMISADSEQDLIRLARLHFGEFHPDLGGSVPADVILAMAEQKGDNL
jgi:hypothetical protein